VPPQRETDDVLRDTNIELQFLVLVLRRTPHELNFDRSFKYFFCRAGHIHMIILYTPLNL
jgi:hypothetical protein